MSEQRYQSTDDIDDQTSNIDGFTTWAIESGP